MNRESNSWFESECVVDKFMCAYPSACHRQSKNINRPLRVSKRVSWIEEFIIYKEACICRNWPSRMLCFVAHSISSQNNSLEINGLAILDNDMLYIFCLEKRRNWSVSKYLSIWIFLEKYLERIQMIMIRVLVSEENSVNIFKAWMYLYGKTPWISQESFTFCLDQEATMPKFCDFHKNKIKIRPLHESPLQIALLKSSSRVHG